MHAVETVEVFSDVFAQRRNLLTGVEARAKLAFTLLGLLINLVSSSPYTPISIAAFCLIALLSIRIPAKTLLLRLAMPLVMGAVVLVAQVFFYGETPLFTITVLRLTAHEEGLAQGLLIMCRVLGGTSLVLFLSMSTPADQLLMAARWFRTPRTFVELALLIYRYIFVLAEELLTMKDAQTVRLGYHNWRQSMRSLNVLGASLILRAYDRAERVFEAMLVRGYGRADSSYCQAFSKKDGLVSLCLGLILAGFYLAGRIGA